MSLTVITDSQIKHISRAIKLAGGQSQLSKALKLRSQSTVSQWVTKRRPLPAKHCLKIEFITGGQVTRYQLRPDIFGKAPKISKAA